MTIDKAIETLNNFCQDIDTSWKPDLPDALKLGIEALQRVQYAREEHWQGWQFQLLGEAKE